MDLLIFVKFKLNVDRVEFGIWLISMQMHQECPRQHQVMFFDVFLDNLKITWNLILIILLSSLQQAYKTMTIYLIAIHHTFDSY